MGELRRQRRLVREDGVLVDDEVASRDIVHRRVSRALDRIDGLFTAHGVC